MSNEYHNFPLFPLKTVIFPDGVMPLRIFETRYIDMLRECMKQSVPQFGICTLNELCDESDPNVEIFKTGTLVQVIDFDMAADQMLQVTVQGATKFEILNTHIDDNNLLRGHIRTLPAEADTELSVEYQDLELLLKKVFADWKKQDDSLHSRFYKANYDSAAWVGSRLSEFITMTMEEKQSLLECHDPLDRLDQLRIILSSQASDERAN